MEMEHQLPFPSQSPKTASERPGQGGCSSPSTPKGGGLAPGTLRLASAGFCSPGSRCRQRERKFGGI